MTHDVNPETTEMLERMADAAARQSDEGTRDAAERIVAECAELHAYANVSVGDLLDRLAEYEAAVKALQSIVTVWRPEAAYVRSLFA